MEFDAFTAGVDPGGLIIKSDIKILICYVLSNLEEGMSKADIVHVFQENNLANYFEASEAFSDLIKNSNICLRDENSNIYTVTESGRMISKQLDSSLPSSIRNKALSASLNLLARTKIENENKVLITQNEHGYSVDCSISGGDLDLLSFKLYVPDMMQAKLVKKNFHDDPEIIYRCMLAMLTKNKDLIEEVLNDMSGDKNTV